MRTHTQRFKDQIKELGREIDSRITYGNNILSAEQLFNISPIVNGNILKSAMKELHFESSIQISDNTVIKYEFGLKVNGVYEFLDYGDYIVYSSEYNEDTKTYKHTCYDSMLFSMKEYSSLQNGTFPMTVRQYITNLCLDCGLTFKNTNDTFANYDKVIQSDLYANLGYTYRDIFDELSQVTASTICIDKSNLVEVRYINNTNDIIDAEFLKDINVTFGEKYGPINSIVLSRSAESDNVYLQDEESVSTNGLCELKIVDNQIMNDNNRSDYLPDILSKLNGLEYYLNDYVSTGILYYELCDRYTIQIEDNNYSCIMFNDEPEITKGIVENIYTERPTESKTDYTKADKTDRRINKTYLIVDKQLGEIRGEVTKVETTVENITTTTQTSTGKNNLHITDSLESNALEYHVEGKSEQETRSGKNKFNTNLVENSTLNGVTLTKNSDGTITLNGTTTSATTFTIGYKVNDNDGIVQTGDLNIKNISGTMSTKIISGSINHSASSTGLLEFNLYDSEGNNAIQSTTKKQIGKIIQITGTLDESVTYNWADITISNSVTCNNLVLGLQVEQGEETEYEQYGASPSPDYPSEIKTIPSIRNWFNPNSKIISGEYAIAEQLSTGIKITSTKDGITGGCAYYQTFKVLNIEKFAGKTLTISSDMVCSSINHGCYAVGTCDVNGSNRSSIKYIDQLTSGYNEMSFTLPTTITDTNKYLYIALYSNRSDATSLAGDYIEYNNLMLVEGTIHRSYVPYGAWAKVKITGKNIFDFKNWNPLINNGTSVIDTGELSLTLTATNNDCYTYGSNIFKIKEQTNYTFRVETDATTQIAFWTVFYDKDRNRIGSSISQQTNEFGGILEKTFTSPANTKYVTIRVDNDISGAVVKYTNFYLAEEDSFSEYEEYKEKEVLIDLSKPNLFDKDNANILTGFLYQTASTIQTSTTDKIIYIPCKSNTTYTITKGLQTTTSANRFKIATTNELPKVGVNIYNFVNGGSDGTTTTKLTIATDENSKYLVAFIYSEDSNMTLDELLSTIKIYEGYDDYHELCSSDDIKDNLNIISGQSTIDKKIMKVVLDGSESWQTPLTTNNSNYRYRTDIISNLVKSNDNSTIIPDLYCSHYNIKSPDGTYLEEEGITISGTNIVIYDSSYNTNDMTAFKTWLSENPVTVYYELAESQQISLPNVNIPLFEGINHISLVDDLETTTSIKYYRNTPIAQDYVVQQQLDETNSNLSTTTDKTNQNASDINATNTNLNNNYYNKDQIDVMNTSTQEIVTQIKNQVETTTTATNLQISILQEQLTNGVTAVRTETGYTFDKDGLKIQKSGSEMSSQLDNDGLVVKRDEIEVLTVRSSGVETENLTVRTHFIIGDNTRVENYKGGTGFFYIGGAN